MTASLLFCLAAVGERDREIYRLKADYSFFDWDLLLSTHFLLLLLLRLLLLLLLLSFVLFSLLKTASLILDSTGVCLVYLDSVE
jgi:hypothetical protein